MKFFSKSSVKVRGVVLTSLIATGSMFMMGCPAREADQLNQGYADGVNLAIAQPKSDGSTCLQKPVKLAEAGCEVGFGAYRFGQMAAEQTPAVPSIVCQSFPDRVNRILTEYYHFPQLNRRQSLLVIQTCENGYAHPREQGDRGYTFVASSIDMTF